MEEKDIITAAEGTETFENQDVKALETMKIKYEQELAKEKQKYSQLLAYTVSGGQISTETPEPEKSLEERYNDACEIIRNKKSSNIEIAQALLEGDSIYRQLNNDRSIFCSEEGTLSDKEEKIADIARDIISTSLDKADDSDRVFTTLAATHII